MYYRFCKAIDGIYNYVKRTIDKIIFDDVELNNVVFYLGTIEENINGLLGLDVLLKSNAVIDLNSMKIIF